MLTDVAARLDAAGVRWVLTGSAGRRLLGGVREPRDLDLEVAVADVPATEAALGVRFAPQQGGGVRSLRAGCVMDGVEVDCSAGVVVEGPSGVLERPDAVLRDGVRMVPFGDRRVPCGAPEETIVRALLRGDWARLAKVAGDAGHPPRLSYVSERLRSIASR